MIEKRRFTRIDYECAVQLKELSLSAQNLLKNSFSKNISQQGLQIISFDFYPVNEKVKIEIFSSKYSSMLQVIGRVVWVTQFPYQRKYRVGIELVDISKAVYRKIKDLIEAKLLKAFRPWGDKNAM